MNNHGRISGAGGILLALSIIGGAIGGLIAHQPSIGVLAGVAVGLTLLVLAWLIDRH